MPTLMIYRGRTNVRRCTAQCYNASGTRCTCICSGMNHGVGELKALQNTDNWRREFFYDQDRPLTIWDLDYPPASGVVSTR
jgi:hypothetical protein